MTNRHHQQRASLSDFTGLRAASRGEGDHGMRFTISSEEKLAMDVMPTGVVIHRPQGPRGGRMSAISVRNEDIPFLAKALQQVLNANREVESL
jgi:hypothetical protein